MKKPLHHQKINVKRHNNDAAKNFDNKTIADRLSTVSWVNLWHPTGVVKIVYGIAVANATQLKGNTSKS